MSDWRHRAACRNDDPERWIPAGDSELSPQQIEDAKAVCAICPVLAPCRAWALATLEYGVAGGLSEDERRALKRRTRRTAARSCGHSPEVQARAVELFRTLRPQCSSNQAACEAVSVKLGIGRVKTVRQWAIDAGLIVPAAIVAVNEQRRRDVVERFALVRDTYRSAHAAHVAIAAEFGVHPDTVREWTRAVRHVSRVGVGGEA